MTNVVALGRDHPMNGTWRGDDSTSTVEFTFQKTKDSFDVTAVDVDDGESLEISHIRWDGELLSFVALTPSTSWRVEIAAEMVDDETVQFATTSLKRLKRSPS